MTEKDHGCQAPAEETGEASSPPASAPQAGVGDGHKYFEAEYTAYRQSEDLENCVAIYAGERPIRNESGSTTAFLRFPAIIVSEYISDPFNFATTVAEVLQENAHRFFSSAAPATDEASHAPDINDLRQRLQLAESIIDGLCNHWIWKAAQKYREKYRG